jgi:hypothetical protein
MSPRASRSPRTTGAPRTAPRRTTGSTELPMRRTPRRRPPTRRRPGTRDPARSPSVAPEVASGVVTTPRSSAHPPPKSSPEGRHRACRAGSRRPRPLRRPRYRRGPFPDSTWPRPGSDRTRRRPAERGTGRRARRRDRTPGSGHITTCTDRRLCERGHFVGATQIDRSAPLDNQLQRSIGSRSRCLEPAPTPSAEQPSGPSLI